MMPTHNKIPAVNIAGRLVVNGKTLLVGQIVENSLVLLEPCEIPPKTEARLIVTVSGRDKVYDIFLPHGSSVDSEVVDFY